LSLTSAPASLADVLAEGAAGKARRGSPRHSRLLPRRHVLVVLLVIFTVVVAAGAWLAVRVYQAGHALLSAQEGVKALVEDVHNGDMVRMRVVLPGVQQDVSQARQAVDDPVWRAAMVVPWAGRQLAAVRTVTVALDDMVSSATPALDAVEKALSGQDAPHSDGKLVLGPLVDALPPVLAAADQVEASSRAIAAIDPAGLTPALGTRVVKIQQQLGQVSTIVQSGTQLAKLLPDLLGANGPRSFLLVSLNSAELRTQGGIVGAAALLQADGGTIDLAEQRTTPAFADLASPILPLTAAEDLIHTDRLGRWIQDATMTPDFPRAAQLIAAHWAAATGQQVDGVIAVDPVAVALLLKATGPVTVASGVTVTSTSFIPELLHRAYLRLPDPAQVDDFYKGTATAIFRAVGNGRGDRLAVVDALARAVQQGRVRIWSAHDDQQRNLLTSSVGAAFLSGPYQDDAGVFLDDGTAGKLDYYLKVTVTIEHMVCTGPNPSATVRLDLSYKPPADVTKQPRNVTGYSRGGLPKGWLATNITVYSPVGAQLGALGLDNTFVSGTTASDAGRTVQVVTSWLGPNDRATYRAVVPVHGNSLTVWTTPSLTSDGTQTATCGG
jgi:hypothetical protein